ncbi:MAG: EF-hand domain-containing protein [Deltaproteobacteria bacterium]
MKKGILFFTFLLIGTFIVFGFQNTVTASKTDKITQKYTASKNDVNYSKCGEGSAAEATPAKKDCSDKSKADHKCSSKEKAKCSGDSSLKTHDKDGDGKLSSAEYKEYFMADFAKCDKNADGKVGADECKMFEKFNSDKNDVMSAEEFSKGHESLFAEMDKDKDGLLNDEEFKSCCSAASADAKCVGAANPTGKLDKKEGCSKEQKAACAKDAKASEAKKCGAGKCCGGGKAENSEKK